MACTNVFNLCTKAPPYRVRDRTANDHKWHLTVTGQGGQCVPIVTELVSGINFDTVNHSSPLWHLENSFSITWTVLQWFHSYLSGRSQFVKINDTKLSVRDLTVGVPQGSVLGPILYLLYTAPLAEIIQSHGLDYHFYAEDTQLYILFKDCDVNVAKMCVENCFADICHWMDVNELKLNHDKTEFMLIYLKYHTRPLFSYFSIGNERLTTTANARSLGVSTWWQHVMWRACLRHLQIII